MLKNKSGPEFCSPENSSAAFYDLSVNLERGTVFRLERPNLASKKKYAKWRLFEAVQIE